MLLGETIVKCDVKLLRRYHNEMPLTAKYDVGVVKVKTVRKFH